MNKKSLIILNLLLIGNLAYGLDSTKESAPKEWKAIEDILIQKNLKEQKRITHNITIPEGSNGSFFNGKTICFDSKGEEIESSDCYALKQFLNTQLGNDNRYKEVSSILERTTPEYKRQRDAQIKEREEKVISDAKQPKKSLSEKLASKECQTHQLEVELCRTTIVEDEMNAAMENEKEITIESGIVNKSRRYAIAANKQFHGTKKIPVLKQKYKSLVGKEFSQSVCDGNGDPADEEIEKCGCTTDLSRANQCP